MKMKCIFPIPMNNIYIKEQEVSRKEKNVKSKLCKKHKLSLNAERIQQSKRLQNTLNFHQKVSQKHTKMKIQSLEQGLPGTVLKGSLTERFWTSTTSS